MMNVTIKNAYRALTKEGYSVSEITQIPEGSNHHVFDILLSDGNSAICKFSKRRYTEQKLVKENTDTLYGGKLSLEREAFLYSLVKHSAKLPAPEVYGIHESEIGDFVVVEKMPGESFKKYIDRHNYSERSFLHVMRALGRDFAKVHEITFSSFGNVMADGFIDPQGLTNFADRFSSVMDMRIKLAEAKGALNAQELCEVRTFFDDKFNDLRETFDIKSSPAVLVLTDFHGDNFFVDENGIPCGYFDLESCQAAPAALEFYGLHFFLFNYFNEDAYHQAERAFYESYTQEGGKYAPNTPHDYQVIDFLAACRLLELTESYWGYIDGLRDTWGERTKTLLYDYMDCGKLDYIALGDIFRERDGQPKNPTRSGGA
jgi:hypothetical protein